MELWLAGIIQATISGAILLFLTTIVKKNSSDSQRATEAEKKVIQRELADMTVKFVALEQKQDKMSVAFYAMRETVVKMIQKQDDFQVRLFELIRTVEDMKANGAFGKVLKR